MKNWKTGWFSKKLDSQTADLYRIMKKIKHSYWINLSDSIKMHSVFSSDKLWKTARNSLTEQIMNLMLSIEISEHDEYKMKQILTFIICYWKLQYRIKWIDHDDDFKWYNTWNLRNSLHAIHNFYQKNLKTLNSSENLNYWLKYWKKNEDAKNQVNNNWFVF